MKKKILVVDDQAVVRNTLSRLLEAIGCIPKTAYDGLDALKSFEDAHRAGTPFDAVILDLNLAGERDGLDVLGRLRELDPGLRAIVTSGYADDPAMLDHGAHGFAGSLPKPFGPEDVKGLMQKLFS